MKQKITIALMILLIAIVVIFMAKDLFKPKVTETNPFVYDLEQYKNSDSVKFCYSEAKRFTPAIENIKAVAADNIDNIFLAGNKKIIKYDSAFQMLTEIPVDGQAFNICVSGKGEIFVGLQNHIEVLNKKGEKLKVWDPFNSKSVITSIAIKGNMVFVADAGNKVILKYNEQGDFLQEIGGKDTANNRKGFIIPSGYFDVAIGRQGEIWAVNPGMHQFEAYNEQGELFSSWKRTSMLWSGFSGCCNPSHIAILPDGSFVTSEKGLVRIKIHEPTGDFKCVVAAPKEFDTRTRGIDLAVDSKSRIIAIIPNENQVRVYEKN